MLLIKFKELVLHYLIYVSNFTLLHEGGGCIYVIHNKFKEK